MGKILIEKAKSALKSFLLALKKWGKAASYAIQH